MSPPQAPAAPPCPYRGLIPFGEEDAPFFFGREAERETITANLMASRLTLFYGTSGTGKTSVLQAGVASWLSRLARENLAEAERPELAVVVFRSWQHEPLPVLGEAVRQAVAACSGEDRPAPEVGGGGWVETLRAWTELVGGPLFLILDQFEEYFLYHGGETGPGTFASELALALQARDLPVSFLIAMREDSLAQLDRLKGMIPNLFANRLRLEHLDRQAARQAIEGPLAEYRRRHGEAAPVEAEPALVQAVLDQVEIGGARPAATGPAAAARGVGRVETAYLQLVLTRLWEEELAAGSRVLRLRTLERLGRVKSIIKAHLERATAGLSGAERLVAADAFRHLVTPSGAKIAFSQSDLAEYTELPAARLQPVLERLSRPEARILRPVAPAPGQPGGVRYEIFHDVLAGPILGWQREVRGRQRLERERRRQWWTVGLVTGALLLAAVGSVAWLLAKARQAAEVRAQSLVLAAGAADDPLVKALILAEADLSPEPARGVEVALAAASLPIPRVVWRGPEGAVVAAFSPDGQRIASGHDDGTVRIWRSDGAGSPRVLSVPGGPVRDVAWSPDGGQLVAVSNQGELRIWRADGEELSQQPRESEEAASSVALGGRFLATGLRDGRVHLVDLEANAAPLLLEGHRGPVWSVQFARDGALLASGSSDGTVSAWRPGGAGPVNRFQCTRPVWDVASSPDGRLVGAACGEGPAWIWRLETSPTTWVSLRVEPAGARSLAFSPDGERVAVGSSSGILGLWKLGADEPEAWIGYLGAQVTSVGFDPGGHEVMGGLSDGTVRAWPATAPPYPRRSAPLEGQVLGVALRPDGRWLAVVSGGEGLRLAGPDQEESTLRRGGTGRVVAAAAGPDGRWVAAAAEDGSVEQWSTEAAGAPRRLAGPGAGVTALAVDREGRLLALGRQDGTILLSSFTGSEPPRVLGSLGSAVTAVALSADGRRAVGGSEDGTVRLFEERKKPWSTVKGVEMDRVPAVVLSLAFSPDGRRVALGDRDGAVTILPADDRGERVELGETGDAVSSLAWSADGRRLITGSAGGRVLIWPVSWRDLLNYLKEATTACLTAEQRRQYLGEAFSDARREFQRCEEAHGRPPGG